MKIRTILTCVALLALLCDQACTAPGTNSDRPDIGGIQGIVRTAGTNTPIVGASVAIGGLTATTDGNGAFSFSGASLSGVQPVVASKAGFITCQRSEDFSTPPAGLILYLDPVDVQTTIDPTVTNTVSTTDGASVDFPAMTGIGENLKVSLTDINVNSDQALGVPGNYGAVDGTGKSCFLTTYGMIDVQITGATSGNAYSLNGKGPFTIRIPVTGDLASAPAAIPLWYFDTATGQWREEGSATLTGGAYVGTVNHFSVWNVDLPLYYSGAVNINIVDNNPAPNQEYEVLVHTDGIPYYQRQLIGGTTLHVIGLPKYGDSFPSLPLSFIQITKVGAGQWWSQTFDLETGADPTVTAVLGDATWQSVAGLTLTPAMGTTTGSITVTWTTEPTSAAFTGVSLNVLDTSTNTIITSATILKNVKTYTFSGLTPGVYGIGVYPQYPVGGGNNGGSLMVGLYTAPTRKLTVNTIYAPMNNSSFCIGVQPQGAAASFIYQEPIDFPLNQKVTLTRPPFWTWSGNIDPAGDIDDGHQVSNTIIMDADKTITVCIYPLP